MKVYLYLWVDCIVLLSRAARLILSFFPGKVDNVGNKELKYVNCGTPLTHGTILAGVVDQLINFSCSLSKWKMLLYSSGKSLELILISFCLQLYIEIAETELRPTLAMLFSKYTRGLYSMMSERLLLST